MIVESKYHQDFGDGADTEHVHGDSHLHGRACNRKDSESRHENQIKLVP